MKNIFISLIILFVSGTAFADQPVSKSYFGSIAIGGVDTTSYHDVKVRKEHQAVMGRSKFTVKWNGANWHFASKQSADKFASSPEKFKPNYNGFCANALSLGEGLVKTDGSIWEFFDNQLFLFYAEGGRQRWLKGDWKTYNQQAAAAWNVLSN